MSGFRPLGREAEDRAADLLLVKGWTLIGRRVKTRRGEIDILALDGEILVIVEVKASLTFEPEWALTEKKKEKLRLAAEDYLVQIGSPDRPLRFDLIAVTEEELRHIEGAFWEGPVSPLSYEDSTEPVE